MLWCLFYISDKTTSLTFCIYLHQSERCVLRSNSTLSVIYRDRSNPPHTKTPSSYKHPCVHIHIWQTGPRGFWRPWHRAACLYINVLPCDEDASGDEFRPNGLNNFINPLGFALVLAAKKSMFSTCDTGEECGGTLCLEPTRVTVAGSGLLANKEKHSGSKRLDGSLHSFYGLLIGMNAGGSGRSLKFAVPFTRRSG